MSGGNFQLPSDLEISHLKHINQGNNNTSADALHNTTGQLQHREKLELTPQLQYQQVDVSSWPPGVYFLRLQARERQVARRFVKT